MYFSGEVIINMNICSHCIKAEFNISISKQISIIYSFLLGDLVYNRKFIQVDFEISININVNVKECF